jgi:peptidyl-prolyl cis-trans isomerase D
MWMQRHKKWLVITVWISTFAFVGAGFVGWGSYTPGFSNNIIATVGTKEIKMQDLQNQYNALYSQYQNTFGQSFNQEMAKQFKLEEIAYNAIVQKFILLNYAQDLGLYITDKDVARYLVSIPSFLKNDKFDKSKYLEILKQNRNTPTNFENQIKNDLLVQKVQTILSTNITNTEIKNLSLLASAQDKVSINIIDSSNFQINKQIDNIMKYYEKNKNNYKSQESYKIKLTKFKIDKKKKEIRKKALKAYLKLKKKELNFENTLTIAKDSDIFTIKNLQKISTSSISSILKPLENKGYYIVVKLIKKYSPKILSFDKAKLKVTNDYIYNQKQKLLQKEIQTIISNFNGEDIGFINKDSNQTIKSLTLNQSKQLTQSIYNSPSTINFIKFNNKAVVFKITDSKLNTNIKNDNKLKVLLENIKNNEIISSLLKQLQNRYEVVSNMKAK